MATLNLTHATEEHLASMINAAPTPDAAAISILTYLRRHSSNTKPARATAKQTRNLTGASLYTALAFLKKAVPNRSLVLSLTYVHIKSELGIMKLRATNGEKFYTVTLNAENQSNIDVLIQFSDLYKLVRTMKKSVISFIRTEESIDLYADNVLSMSFGDVMEVDEFYEFPTGRHTLSDLYAEAFTVDFLKRVVPFASDDPSHPVLGSIHIAQDNTSAADGFRLSYTPAARAKDTDHFLPRDLVLDATAHIKSKVFASWHSVENSDDKLVTLSGHLKSGSLATLTAYVDRGTYPDVKRIIPSNRNIQIRVMRSAFLGSLKKVQPVSAQLANIVTLDIIDGAINASAKGETSSTTVSTPCINKSGNHLTIGMNANFLIESVESLPCDELLLSFNAATQPMIIEASDKSSAIDTLIVIMPMHLGRQ